MGWTRPEHSRGRVDAAGDALANLVPGQPITPSLGIEQHLEVINNWRSAHSYPLQAQKMTLRGRARGVDAKALVAQRLKRLASIDYKLRRNPNMKLSQMQDIGGCRAIVRSIVEVNALVKAYADSAGKNPNNRAQYVKTFDYIKNPKPDGYRSIHLIYKYRGAAEKHQCYNGLRVEIQLRSRPQHVWATAVEIASTFTGQALKSNVGDEAWKRFFALMGSVIALREKQPPVPGAPPTRKALAEEIEAISRQLNIQAAFEGWSGAVEGLVGDAPVMKVPESGLYLLQLDSTARRIGITAFRQEQFQEASEKYLEAEKDGAGRSDLQVVLVSSDSLAAIRKAYPNYYLETNEFLAELRRILPKK